MSLTEPIDTTEYDFDSWMRFAFDHPVSKEPWYYSEPMRFVCNRQRVINYYTRLFLNPRPVLAPYDDARIEQGVWFVVGNQLHDWLWDRQIPVQLRQHCIEAMPTMFREFLSDHPLDTACFMWWDLLRYFGDSPDQTIVASMIGALEQVLALSARHCQMSALHGLGHLRHGSKEMIIRSFLAANVDADDELRQYAENAIVGTVL